MELGVAMGVPTEDELMEREQDTTVVTSTSVKLNSMDSGNSTGGGMTSDMDQDLKMGSVDGLTVDSARVGDGNVTE